MSTEISKQYSISFFFPAFNDEGTIEEMVEAGRRVLSAVAKEFEIIIINDGSVDNTAGIANAMAQKYPEVRVIHHPYNIGYGAALKSGFGAARYELIFYTDGDHQFNIDELKLLLPYIPEYDLVSGYRKNRAYPNAVTRTFASHLYNIFIRLFFSIKFVDVDCSFKLMKRDVVKKSATFINSAFICAGMFYEAQKNGKKIIQVPVTHYERKYGTSSSFSFVFILRSIVELFEAMWELKYKEKYYAFRQRQLKKKIQQ